MVDGILHQVADAVDAMGGGGARRRCGSTAASRARTGSSSGSPTSPASASSARPARDSTALGAATLAGLAAGLWSGLDALPEIPLDLVAEPALAPADRARERERWAAARDARRGLALTRRSA